jgi:hypothetical protein
VKIKMLCIFILGVEKDNSERVLNMFKDASKALNILLS